METMTAKLIESMGLRRTQAREVILNLLSNAGCPLSHQEIISKKVAASFDRVTIYRTLESLQKVGLLHCIIGSDGIWRFCAHKFQNEKKCSGNHIHFFCCECSQLSCMPDQPLPWIHAPIGAKIHSKQLLVNGICSKCNSKLIAHELKGNNDD